MNTDLAIAAGLDPAWLFRAAGLKPDPWQADVLRGNYPRLLLCCSRQSGKTTTVSALALHPALYEPGSLTLLLAPSERQSEEAFRKVMSFYRMLSSPVRTVKWNTQVAEFANGSRLIALPGKEVSIRGYSSVRRLVIDEAARVPDPLYKAVRPMVAVSGGDIVGLSTPFGKRGWFYEEWQEGGDDWKRVGVRASDCPRIPKAFLEEERRKLGDYWYSQEYDCSFNDVVDSVFQYEDVMAAQSEEVAPLFGAAAA